MTHLIRKNILLQAKIEAVSEVITAVTINYASKKITISWAAVNGEGAIVANFNPIILHDEDESHVQLSETLKVKDNIVTLAYFPLPGLNISSDGRTLKEIIDYTKNDKAIKETADYTINDKVITFLNVQNGKTVNISYMRILPASTAFTDFDDSVGNALEITALKSLVQAGYSSGAIEA